MKSESERVTKFRAAIASPGITKDQDGTIRGWVAEIRTISILRLKSAVVNGKEVGGFDGTRRKLKYYVKHVYKNKSVNFQTKNTGNIQSGYDFVLLSFVGFLGEPFRIRQIPATQVKSLPLHSGRINVADLLSVGRWIWRRV